MSGDGYIKVPEAVVTWRGLPSGVLRTYLALMSFAWGNKAQCWPSHLAIAERAGFRRRTVIRHLAVLEKQHLIEVVRRPGWTDFYTIVPRKFSPDLAKSMREALPKLHPLLMRKTTNREWQVLIKHDRMVAGRVRR